MPPRKSRQKKRPQPEPDLEEATNAAVVSKKSRIETSPSSSNTQGFPSLPVNIFEQIFEILLDGSKLISREDILSNQTNLDEQYQYRADILRSLAQTCRSVRQACLPRYYEHFEACACRGPRVWYKQVSERLHAISLLLAKCSDLAVHVRTVTVSLTRCSTETILPAFAACLKALPNLHTLQIIHAHSQMTTALKNAFENTTLPQVRTIVLPECAHNVMRSCPNIQDLTCNDTGGSKLVSAMAKSSRNVEIIRGVSFSGTTLQRLVKAAPKLREIDIRDGQNLHLLAKFKQLDTIHLRVDIDSTNSANVAEDLAAALTVFPSGVEDAKKALASNSAKGSKTVRVTFYVRSFASWDQPPWKCGAHMQISV